MSKTPRILITNDDGIHGPGLHPLAQAMRKLGRVTIVVPDAERSADSHSLTLHKPLRLHRVDKDFYSLNGSPADCTRFATLEIFKSSIDLVVSGINKGLNLGEDVIYSGTVAAAREGTLLSAPSLAFSQTRPEKDNPAIDFGPGARFALRMAKLVLRNGLGPGLLLNVNFPSPRRGAFRGAQITRLGRRLYTKVVTKRTDPRGTDYYWLTGKTVGGVPDANTDVRAIARGFISVTPLHIDNTDFPMLETLKEWGL